MSDWYKNHTNNDLIKEGEQLTATPLEREMAERIASLVDYIDEIERIEE